VARHEDHAKLGKTAARRQPRTQRSKTMKSKPNLYINPKAPEWVEDMFREIFPDANDVSAEEMESKMKKIVGDAIEE
jgi:hypothetical protein